MKNCSLMILEIIAHADMRYAGRGNKARDHGMDTQDLEFKFFAKRVETSYVVTATYV